MIVYHPLRISVVATQSHTSTKLRMFSYVSRISSSVVAL